MTTPEQTEREALDWALDYTRLYWQHGDEVASQRALTILGRAVERSRHPRPATVSEPAPELQVPAGGWRDGWVIRRGDAAVLTRRDGRWYSTASGISTTDEQINIWLEDGDAVIIAGPATPRDPEPEPVGGDTVRVDAGAVSSLRAALHRWQSGHEGYVTATRDLVGHVDAFLAAVDAANEEEER